MLARLATLVPRPRLNLVRYHGVFAPNSKLRRRIVPDKPSAPIRPPRNTTSSKLTWAERLRRAFAFDVTICPLCSGTLRVIADITAPTSSTRSSPTSEYHGPRPRRPPGPLLHPQIKTKTKSASRCTTSLGCHSIDLCHAPTPPTANHLPSCAPIHIRSTTFILAPASRPLPYFQPIEKTTVIVTILLPIPVRTKCCQTQMWISY
jgi:hypothetical protein